MFGHHYFGSHFFGPHYFGPAVTVGGGGGGGQPGTGGGGVADPCEVTYTVQGVCEPATPAQGSVVGPQGPPGPPGSQCEWCCPIFCDPGSPEGVVTSPIGGIYEQTDAAATTHSLWAKRTGIGNTGWVAWIGLRGSATGSFAIGDNAIASGVDSIAFGEDAQATGLRAEAFGKSSVAAGVDGKAFGAGAIVSADRGIAIGAGANVATVEGISIGDALTRSINDISIGWSHDFGAAVAHGSVLIGKNATINTGVDSASSTVADYGAHILIGENTETPYAASQFHNIVVGFAAKARGRGCVIIGDQAESRAANTPVAGQSEGRFATLLGYLVKGSGGCIVAVGDQADVRGDSTAALGTHARANDNNTLAVGPNAFAGSATSNGTGSLAVALGVGAQATTSYGLAVGSDTSVIAALGTAVGPQASVTNILHVASVGLGYGGRTKRANQLMIGGNWVDGFLPITEICFNGSNIPAFIVSPDGFVTINDVLGTTTSRQWPIAADVTLTANERYATMNATAAARNVTMPTTASVPASTRIWVARASGANTITILPQGGDTIDGGASITVNNWALLRRNGTNWALDDSN